MDARGQEFDCRTVDVSPGDVLLASDAPVASEDSVVVYCDQLGRLAGKVARVVRKGLFAVVCDATPHKREKTAETLMRLIHPGDFEAHVARREPRFRASGAEPMSVTLDTGVSLPVEILDFSIVGAALKSKARPPIGAWVRVGAVHGRVARYFEHGFAVDFEQRPKHG